MDEWGDLKVEDKKDESIKQSPKVVEKDEDDWGNLETPVQKQTKK